MASKVSLSKGTRDFGPEQVAKRQYIINIIRETYELHGFQPLETPAIEKLSTLMGKYGDEGDALLFKLLRSGDFLKKADDESLQNRDFKKLLPAVTERGLRYDLTIPFARYVVMNQSDIAFPFKRYQIQPVWRADRPQKGRYQEFIQCDADIIGSDSLYNEVELLQIIDKVYKKLKLDNVSVKINSRKVLQGIAEVVNAEDKFVDLTVAIDKLDKIGVEKVLGELLSRGLTESSVEQLKAFLEFSGNNDETLAFLNDKIASSETGKAGIEEMSFIINKLGSTMPNLSVDIMLARGLSYYTGTILEVMPIGTEMKSSISGGGRYDDLTGNFGMPGVSGVGFSFGLDRIYDVMNELDLFKEIDLNTTKLLFISFDEECQDFVFESLNKVRARGIASEMYPLPISQSKMKKQMKYANDKKIPFVAIVGSNEMESQQFSLKNMTTGEQQLVDIEALMTFCKS